MVGSADRCGYQDCAGIEAGFPEAHGRGTRRSSTVGSGKMRPMSISAHSPPTPADLFSSSYALARQRLLTAAARRGLQVEQHVHPLRGKDGEELAMDVVRDGPSTARHLLLLTSGVHGVEGFAGSAVQTGLLALRPTLVGPDEQDLAVLHVHAVNPYGFSFCRRVNEDNVDLNRNFVDFTQPLPVNTDYSDFHRLLLPASWPPSPEQQQALAALKSSLGPRRSQLALSGGQHSHPHGLFFGGLQPSWSNRVFREVLRRHVGSAQHLAWIDLHTGLGPYGVGERIFACDDVGGALQRARRWWGDNITSVHTGSSTSIPMTGPIQNAVAGECPQVTYTGICLEFGTLPSAAMHQALCAEQCWHAQPQKDPAQAAAIQQQMLDAFYPNGGDWKQAVWAQACEATEQAVVGLRSV